jgi:hypothetical protein
MARDLFTNRNSRGDFFREALFSGEEQEPVFIASAFFTEYDLLEKISVKSRRVRLIVRLGFPTSPMALDKALKDPFVDVRFFSDSHFHPKVYLFGDRVAYVGSANLTYAASIRNQEVVVAVPGEDPRFAELAMLFGEYWEQASVLTPTILKEYREVFAQSSDIEKKISALDQQVASVVGDKGFKNIDADEKRLGSEELFVDSYRKTYQDSVRAFMAIQEVYLSRGVRKIPEERLPVRLEIDSFFSYVRDEVAKGDSWEAMPLGWNESSRAELDRCLDEWFNTYWRHLESTIVGVNYPRLVRTLGSPNSIASSSDDEIFDALTTLHSFHDSFRFHRGGMEGLKRDFIGSNDMLKVRSSLTHLLHGSGDLVRRMADLIYTARYKINVFGTANVQELVGWFNNEGLPVVNGRTTKILRYFGFDVRQLS